MKTFSQLVADTLPHINEVFPWDLADEMENGTKPMLIDIREADEFAYAHIQGSVLVPRGILESACDYGYAETVPALAAARESDVVLICRSGNRSALATLTMQLMGFNKVRSLKTGLAGWNDNEQPLVNLKGEQVDIDEAEEFFSPEVTPEQLKP